MEFKKKIKGYGCIAITLIMNKLSNTASNVIIREIVKKCYGKKTTKELLIEAPSEIFIRGMSLIFFNMVKPQNSVVHSVRYKTI